MIFNSLGSNYNSTYVLKSLIQQEKGSLHELARFLAKKYNGAATLTYKGRQAIILALQELKLPKNSKVAITGYTCIAVINAVQEAGLLPVFLDIDPNTLNFTPNTFEQELQNEKQIKAVIIQNTLGYPCEIEKIHAICKKQGVTLIEDLAHSIGARYPSGVETGSIGDAVILSFSQDKVVDSVSGGALIIRNQAATSYKPQAKSSSPSFQDKYYPLFTFIIRKTYSVGLGKVSHKFLKTFGLLSNPMKVKKQDLSDWHAMLALGEFRTLEKSLSHRKNISQIYKKNIQPKFLSTEIVKMIEMSANLRFPIFINNRQKVIKELKNQGFFLSDIWYDAPVAPKRFLEKSGYRVGECPNAEAVSQIILNLPTHKNISEKDAVKISEIINTWAK